jgi:hypothetical protein
MRTWARLLFEGLAKAFFRVGLPHLGACMMMLGSWYVSRSCVEGRLFFAGVYQVPVAMKDTA